MNTPGLLVAVLPARASKKMVPMMATPSAPASWLVVLNSPEALPASLVGTSESTKMPTGATTIPNPAPLRARPANKCHGETVPPTACTVRIRTTNPAATTSGPSCNTTRPILRASMAAEIPARIGTMRENGTMVRPAFKIG